VNHTVSDLSGVWMIGRGLCGTIRFQARQDTASFAVRPLPMRGEVRRHVLGYQIYAEGDLFQST
jgi:hypothetical protein